ncbi:hypothetical protein CMV_022452 [Castanea mollissima]|uniref:Uncharacterized protein n=1 Tax=Castanea mollissima TaxID=60419 RepID=A0A8J4QDU8_9ROSI|nr:hypothetical protein CMV_022452 [Castanea mollissima]
MANLKAPGLTAIAPNFLDLFWCVKEAKPSQDIDTFAALAWSIWNNRNAVRHGETGRTALQIFEASRAFLNEFQSCSEFPRPPRPHGPGFWKPPPLDEVGVRAFESPRKYRSNEVGIDKEALQTDCRQQVKTGRS